MNDRDKATKRIELLEEFRRSLHAVWNDSNGAADARSFILRNSMAAKQAVAEAGVPATMQVSPPPAIGGPIMDVDLFDNVFKKFYRVSILPDLDEAIEKAIGVYEHLRDETGLVTLVQPEALDALAAIERALRPAFRNGPPAVERDVQDAIETILQAAGVRYTREQETAPVGPRAFTPDFVLTDLDTALEVKLATPKHGASDIQEELAADIAAYPTKWKRCMFVIYDLSTITDPDALRRANMDHFGVTVLIVKH